MTLSADDICQTAMQTNNLELVLLIIEDEYRPG